MNIGFFVRHFTEMGTEVAVYDYAKYNEEILNNKSYIICFTPETQGSMHGWPTTRVSYDKFNKRFKIIEIQHIGEMTNIIKEFNLSFFYTLTHGGEDVYQFNNKDIWGNCKTIKHCVYSTSLPEGDFHFSISNTLNKYFNTSVQVIPHIVNLPLINENLRNELQIPQESFVFGRHGGFYSFNIDYVNEIIIEYLNLNENCYFLLLNTSKFYEHPRIIYLDLNTDEVYKSKFINTCDVMIHAQKDGETFGLAVAEFSSKNKPVITCNCGHFREHIDILGDKGIIYHSKEELRDIFMNIETIIKKKSDWNAYKFYSPENVMNLMKSYIFDK